MRVIEGTGTTISIDNGVIRDIATRFFGGAGARALVGGSWGFASSEDTSRADKTVDEATRLARLTQKATGAPEFTISSIRYEERHAWRPKINPLDIPIEEKIELIGELEGLARAEGVSSTSGTYSETVFTMRYRNSEGEEVEFDLTRSGFQVMAVAKENGVYQMARESRFDTMGWELFDHYDARSLAEGVGRDAVALLSAKKPPGGRLPVILDPELAGVFVHEAVGHASEADIVLSGDSILEGKIGEKVASDLVNVYDDPTIRAFGHYPYDDEGVPSRRRPVIEDGVLISYLHSRETAARLGSGEPGNARAQGYMRPIVRMSNTFIDNGDSAFEELLKEIGDGVYLIGSRGGQVNTGEGVFQFSAEKGYLVEGGEITDMLRDVSLSGHTLEILHGIELLAGDLRMNSGRCGKGGQLVPVGDGSPHILVREAVVGGSA